MKLTTAQAHGPHRASARSAARLVAAPLVALVLIIVGGTAYADVDWEVKSVDGGYKARIAPYPHTDKGRMGAVAEFLGFDWDSLSSTTQQKILADESGAVTLIRDQRIKNLAYEYFEGQGTGVIGEFLEFAGNAVVAFWSKTFGSDQVWMAECSYDEYGNARAVFLKYAYANDGTTGDDGGGSGGGGSGGVAGAGVLVYTGNGIKYNDLDEITVLFTDSAQETIDSIMGNTNNGFKKYYISFKETNNSSNCWIWFTNSEELEVVNTNDKLSGMKNNTDTRASFNNHYARYNISNNVLTIHTIDLNGYGHNISAGGTYSLNNICYFTTGGGSTGDGGTSEPYVPTPDVDPTRPVIQIGDVTVDLSNGPYTVNNTTYSLVYAPDNSWSIQVTTHTDTPYDGNVTASDPTDYTSILNAILAAINKFRTEFNTAYNDIDAQLTTMLNQFTTALKNVETTLNNQLQAMQTQNHQDIQTLQTNLQNNFNGKMDAYTTQLWSNLAAMDQDLLEELFKDAKYIVDNLNFNADFDDSDIVLWLKRIYSRVKDRKVSIPAPDEDPTGWADAIAEFLEKILAMMVTGLDVAQISELFDDLKNRFPISIPWDMVALLYLFDGEPVTPEFDWPMYIGDTKVTDLHCDFSDFDDAMVYVRQGELLLFAIGLMYNTKWLMNVESEVVRRKG